MGNSRSSSVHKNISTYKVEKEPRKSDDIENKTEREQRERRKREQVKRKIVQRDPNEKGER